MKDFLKEHNINSIDSWPEVEKCYDAIITMINIVKYIEQTVVNSENLHKKNLSVSIFSHLTDRTSKYLISALSCILTNNSESSDIISRTAIESSIRIRYFIKNDPESSILQWLKRDVNRKQKDIENWENYIHEKIEGKFNLDIVDTHKNSLEKRKNHQIFKEDIVENLKNEAALYLNINENIQIARKIFPMFVDLGEELLYYNIYSRLSSESHTTAEDTIDYIYHTSYSNEDTKIFWANELLASRKLMFYIGVREFIKMTENIYSHFSEENHLICGDINKYSTEITKLSMEISDEYKW